MQKSPHQIANGNVGRRKTRLADSLRETSHLPVCFEWIRPSQSSLSPPFNRRSQRLSHCAKKVLSAGKFSSPDGPGSGHHRDGGAVQHSQSRFFVNRNRPAVLDEDLDVGFGEFLDALDGLVGGVAPSSAAGEGRNKRAPAPVVFLFYFYSKDVGSHRASLTSENWRGAPNDTNSWRCPSDFRRSSFG
jgi:hypothetical protein